MNWKNRKKKVEFRVNDYLVLRLENNLTNIYVKGKLFNQCKFLLLNIPVDRVNEFDEIDSIDEAAERLDSSMERLGRYRYGLTPETEFWGHCSNLQAWYENDYDTRLIHRNLAFPLLKALVEAGDPQAKKVFKEEIAMRLESGYPSVVVYLINQNYLKYLNRKELEAILDNPNFIEIILNYTFNFNNIPKWLLKDIEKQIPDFKANARKRISVSGLYDATFKIVVFGDPEAKKTELTQRYLTNLFVSDSKMTIGVDFEVKSLIVDNSRVKLQIWDFGGEQRFRFLLPTYVRGARGGLFVYDISKKSTLAHIEDWLSLIKRDIGSQVPFPIIVVGIVSESEEEREILAEEGIRIALSNNTDGFIECSPRTGENVEEAFEALTRLMLQTSQL